MKRAPNMKAVVAVTIVAFVVGVGACFYQYSALSDVDSRVESLQKKSKDEKALTVQAEKTATQLKETSELLAHLEKSVPEFAYVPTLMRELSEVGKKNGIQVLGIRPAMEAAKKDDKKSGSQRKSFAELKLEVKGRGTYRSVINFLKALDQFPKIVAARTITMSPKLEVGQTTASRLDVTIELKTYVFPPAEKPKETSAGREVANTNG